MERSLQAPVEGSILQELNDHIVDKLPTCRIRYA